MVDLGPSLEMCVSCLIVDDNSAFLDAARTLLEREGLRVVGLASTTAEAVASVQGHEPDVVLVDISLGDECGFDLARLLAVDPVHTARVILISTSTEDDLVDLLAQSPAIGFLSKSALSADAIRGLLGGG